MPNDYLKEIDLATGPGGPVINPLDARAMHYFGFLSDGQEIVIVPPFDGPMPKVYVSWQFVNQALPAFAPPPPQPDAVLDPSFGPPVLRYDGHHERRHAIVWMDPASGTTGPVTVRIRAWARE